MERPIETRTLGDTTATQVLIRDLPSNWVEFIFCCESDDGDLYEKVRISMPADILAGFAEYHHAHCEKVAGNRRRLLLPH